MQLFKTVVDDAGIPQECCVVSTRDSCNYSKTVVDDTGMPQECCVVSARDSCIVIHFTQALL